MPKPYKATLRKQKFYSFGDPVVSTTLRFGGEQSISATAFKRRDGQWHIYCAGKNRIAPDRLTAERVSLDMIEAAIIAGLKRTGRWSQL